MGCAPSKQNCEDDVDPDQRPLEANDKKSPKSKKSPKKGKGHKGQADDKLANNNAKDEVIQEEIIQPAESAPNNLAAPAVQHEQEVPQTDVDTVVPQRSAVVAASPTSPSHKQRGELWDLAKGMPPPTSPYDAVDGETSPPAKPPRHVNWDQKNSEPGKDNYHTFPRRQKARPVSARDKYMEEGSKSSTLERKLSLRERTPERRKDLDVSGNIYMGKMLELPGRGKVIPTDKVEFLNPADIDVVHVEDTKDATLPRGSVKEIANAFLELTKKKEEELKPKTPIKHVKKAGSSCASDDALSDDWEIVEAGEGDLSVIETVNKQILEEYKAVERKTFEQIEEERLVRVAEEERIQAEQEAIRLAEEERIRVEEERIRAEEERIRAEEERIRAEEERIRAEEERIRVEQEEERIRAEEERLRVEQEEEARRLAETERIQAEEKQQQEDAETEAQNAQEDEKSPEEQGDDPAATGAAHEDRLYNNKAFDKPDIDSSDPQQQDAALKIQTKYRQHHAKEVVSQKREEVAAVKIQAGYRGWHDRKRVNNIRAEADSQSQQAAVDADQEDAEAAERGDINLDDPEVEAAATKIQAGFKGYKARKEVQSIKDQKSQSESQPEEEAAQNAINYDDPEVVGAATKIQAGFRGHQTRKDMAAVKGQEEAPQESTDEPAQESTVETTDDQPRINLDDPEANLAASKIQAGFKGMKTRKDMKAKREAQDGEPGEQPEAGEAQSGEETQNADAPVEDPAEGGAEVDIDLNDPEVSKAATKIQASFKGYMVRKERASNENVNEDDQTEAAQDGQTDGVAEASESPAPQGQEQDAAPADSTQ